MPSKYVNMYMQKYWEFLHILAKYFNHSVCLRKQTAHHELYETDLSENLEKVGIK